MNRRNFIETTLIGSSAMIVPRFVLGRGYTAPSDKLNLAGVGIGGVGKSYLQNVESEAIITLCDVDLNFAQSAFEKYPDAKVFQDFREMLDAVEIDGVVIGTPDHTHAIIAKAALKRGKHVYCAKPLTRTIYESRQLTKLAKETGVATQMSIQMNAAEEHRLIEEWITDGAIGDVREVHIWSNRPIWPQGIESPVELPSVPPSLDWNLWIGPAPFRPYHPVYHPFKFRGWYDFGTGALGDMGCHQFDPVVKALKLEGPTSIYASSTELFPETFPKASIIYYDFPARENKPPVKVIWYDGGLKPERPPELETGRDFGEWNGGLLFIGDEGKLLASATGQNPRLIPEAKMKSYKRPPQSLPRSIGHYEEWVAACKGGPAAGADFSYGGPLTEIVLLGNIAVRTRRRLNWEKKTGRFIDDNEANAFLKEPYFHGWSI